MKKRGVSGVFAVVIILILSLVAIGVLWSLLAPNIKANLSGTDDYRKVSDIRIDSLSGYTCYDATNKIFAVQIKKGADVYDVVSLKFYLIDGGNSVYYQQNYDLAQNSERTFFLNTSLLTNVERVDVVPVFRSKNKELDGVKTSLSKFDRCNLADVDGVIIPGVRVPSSTDPASLVLPSNIVYFNATTVNSQVLFRLITSQYIDDCEIYIDDVNNFSLGDMTEENNYYFSKNVSGFSIGLHSWYAICELDYSNSEVTSSVSSFYITQPNVTLVSPTNGSLLSTVYPTFRYIVNDSFSNCSIYVNATNYSTNTSVSPNVNITSVVSLAGLTAGNYYWYVSCSYSNGRVNSTNFVFNISDFRSVFDFNYSSGVFSKLGVQNMNLYPTGNFTLLNISMVDEPGSNLRLYYDFEFNNSTHTFDHNSHTSQPTKSHGLFRGTPVISSSSGLNGNYLDLDGVNDYIQINSGTTGYNEATDAILNAFDNNFSISMWIKTRNNASAAQYIFHANEYHEAGSCDASTGYTAVYLQNHGVYFEFRQYATGCNSFTGQVGASFPLSNSSWRHLVVTRQVVNSTLAYNRIYVNGQLVNTSTSNQGQDLRMQSHYHIGALGDYAGGQTHQYLFNGSIDDFIVFKKMLNSTEIAELYNNQSKLFNSTGIITYSNQSISDNTTQVTLLFNVSRPYSTTTQARAGYGNNSVIANYTTWTELNSTGGVAFTIPSGNTILTPQLRLSSDAYQFYSPRVY